MNQELCWEKVKGKCKRTGSRGGRDTEMETGTGTGRKERGDRTVRCQKTRQRRCQRKVAAGNKRANTAGIHAKQEV